MKRVADREIAERALKALRSLNTSARNHTLAELDALRLQIAPTTPDHERADAWLAVCAFCEAVKPGSPLPTRHLFTALRLPRLRFGLNRSVELQPYFYFAHLWRGERMDYRSTPSSFAVKISRTVDLACDYHWVGG